MQQYQEWFVSVCSCFIPFLFHVECVCFHLEELVGIARAYGFILSFKYKCELVPDTMEPAPLWN